MCDTEDAFKAGKLEKIVDNQSDGTFGEPHGMHPVNDFSWFGEATDTFGAVVKAGWHAVYSKRPGKSPSEPFSAPYSYSRKLRLPQV